MASNTTNTAASATTGALVSLHIKQKIYVVLHEESVSTIPWFTWSSYELAVAAVKRHMKHDFDVDPETVAFKWYMAGAWRWHMYLDKGLDTEAHVVWTIWEQTLDEDE